ncbi:Acyl-CoA-binding protein [Flavobacterium succinicans]|jgi:diazepam-binding inhibitor (GABA receptor modulating acyl-CoA-binding protein)|uniref:Acyl-CoA-binding protein n=1 Tax=Flavobacterium succinicans TaxID=29536 RepID=A0A1I4UII3_9FLAO|nr:MULTISPECIES: acyl-CoA-binding protein [Flavobacterium]OOV29693.1 phosphatidylserine decarboxylase [Flavobacterium sp. LM5]SFM88768.1 Acyl-CoA-binding protein [Flavobacterium succinicans]
MTNDTLELEFKEAFEKASNMTQPLPPDVMLRLYAYFKQATFGTSNYNRNDNFDLRNAFKTNAWIQISHLTQEQAKKKYIETVNDILKNNPS